MEFLPELSVMQWIGAVLLVSVALAYLRILARSLDGIPGPIPLPLLGSLHLVGFNPLHMHHLVLKVARKYGNIARVTMGFDSFVFVNGTDAMKQVLSRGGYSNFDRGAKEQYVNTNPNNS